MREKKIFCLKLFEILRKFGQKCSILPNLASVCPSVPNICGSQRHMGAQTQIVKNESQGFKGL